LVDVVEGYYIEDKILIAQSLSTKIGTEYEQRIQLFGQVSAENQRQLLSRIQNELTEYNYFVQIVKAYDSSAFGNQIESEFNKNLELFSPLLDEKEED